MTPPRNQRQIWIGGLLLGTLLINLTACGQENMVSDAESFTATAQLIPEVSPSPAYTSTPTGPPPAGFQSDLLRDGIIPVDYIQDSCRYLELRWDPQNSAPGTIVAPIMFHGILRGSTVPTDDDSISFVTFMQIVWLAQKLGYETITTEELLAFLQENAKIPRRSMILILDDRRPGTAEEYFLPVNKENDWTTTLAWIVGDTDQRAGLWERMERLNDTGYFDVQSHGLNHIYLNDRMSEETVREEIEGSIPILKQHFGEKPLAYIWPGGNYTKLGIEIAHQAGFELGFTIHSRGPILFNWIPQGEKELTFGDPFMLLPRFWDTAALLNLDRADQIGDAARDFAEENYPAEAEWFQQNCSGELPPLGDVLK